jgi:hypothetical protein
MAHDGSRHRRASCSMSTRRAAPCPGSPSSRTRSAPRAVRSRSSRSRTRSWPRRRTTSASQADEVVVTPSSITGSIGVVIGPPGRIRRLDESRASRRRSSIAGEHKVETYPSVPLSDDARAHTCSRSSTDVYGIVHDAVAKGRGVTTAKVKADFGQGRVLSPSNAVAAGMADRVGTYEDAVGRLAAGKVVPHGAKAEVDGTTRLAIENDLLPIEAIRQLPAEARADAWRVGLASGRFSVNAVREAEGIGPIQGGETSPVDDPDASATGRPARRPTPSSSSPRPALAPAGEAPALPRPRARGPSRPARLVARDLRHAPVADVGSAPRRASHDARLPAPSGSVTTLTLSQ